jgi:hypothetical protein
VDIKPYRKFVVAFVAAAVTVANAFGVPVVEEASDEAIAVFDALAALLVFAVPNADPQ